MLRAGLPTDPLSIQNGILVTRSSRFPLLIDPQGQAVGWITCREKERLPAAAPTVQLMDPKIKDKLEFAMQEGKAFIVLGVENEIDPMFDPVLEKEYVQKGRRWEAASFLPSYFTDTTRLRQTRPWVVSCPILSLWKTRSPRTPERESKLHESRRWRDATRQSPGTTSRRVDVAPTAYRDTDAPQVHYYHKRQADGLRHELHGLLHYETAESYFFS